MPRVDFAVVDQISVDAFKTRHRTGDHAFPPVAINTFYANLSIGL